MHNTIKILVVDLTPTITEKLAGLLSKAGAGHYQLSWSDRIDCVLGHALDEVYQVVILAWQWPHDRCLDLLNSARRQGAKTPIIVLTELLEPEVDRDAINAGASDYLIEDTLSPRFLERALRYATQRKRVEQRLTRLAHYDPLTNIPNRMLFSDRLDHALRIAERDELSFALLYIDLDGFKQINDSYGHDVGDALLEACAQRLSGCLRCSDTVARMGGDEFVLLLEHIDSHVDVAHITEKVINALTLPYQLCRQSVSVGCSIGIAIYPDAGTDADSLQRNADMAMYQAKLQGTNGYYFFTEAMGTEVRQQLLMESQLRRALRRQELMLVYQPRIELKSGRLLGLEALLRWQHPQLGVLKPEAFIPIAESSGLMAALGYWVIRQACSDLKGLRTQGLPPVPMAINLSIRQFNDEQLVERIVSILAEQGIAPHDIEFELSERAIMENLDLVGLCMLPLAHLGCRFALDDFGTAYSSFPQLQRLPISTIKVDKRLIAGMLGEPQDAQLVQAMIQLAHSLDKTVIAEGVELAEQSVLLQQYGCDGGQGFFFSEPVELEELEQRLAELPDLPHLLTLYSGA